MRLLANLEYLNRKQNEWDDQSTTSEKSTCIKSLSTQKTLMYDV